MGPKKRSLRERFEEKTCPEPTTGCLLWTGAVNNNGYGAYSMRPGNTRLAHRVAWALEHGPIPDGLDVCHHCDTPACVNVDHLFVGTHADNMADMQRKGRNAILLGFENPKAKLTPETLARLRALRAQGHTYIALAKTFGMTREALSMAVRGRTYAA